MYNSSSSNQFYMFSMCIFYFHLIIAYENIFHGLNETETEKIAQNYTATAWTLLMLSATSDRDKFVDI